MIDVIGITTGCVAMVGAGGTEMTTAGAACVCGSCVVIGETAAVVIGGALGGSWYSATGSVGAGKIATAFVGVMAKGALVADVVGADVVIAGTGADVVSTAGAFTSG